MAAVAVAARARGGQVKTKAIRRPCAAARNRGQGWRATSGRTGSRSPSRATRAGARAAPAASPAAMAVAATAPTCMR